MGLFDKYKTAAALALPPEVSDLDRVLALPRRKQLVQVKDEKRVLDPSLQSMAQSLEERLAKKTSACKCGEKYKRACAKHLNPIQTWGLWEGAKHEGLLGPIGVGDGKTLLDLLMPMVMPNCRTAVLLVQPNLRHQLTEVDWGFYGEHWELPNLSLKGPKWGVPGRPWLHVVAFTELSSKLNSDILERINPDLIILDEAQNVKDPAAARTKRFLRFLESRPHVRVCAWSGTLTSRSLHDYAHLSRHALKKGSPCPLDKNEVFRWAQELDPNGGIPPPPGILTKELAKGGDLLKAWSARLLETSGVVASPEISSYQGSIYFSERKTTMPPEVGIPYAKLENEWVRPDGEELKTAIDKYRCASELSCGFYYRWKWPKEMVKEEQKKWFEARQKYNKEVRTKLATAKEFMDSPGLLDDAAQRWYGGYTADDPITKQPVRFPAKCKDGPLPVWNSVSWPEWEREKLSFKSRFARNLPETEPVWLSDWLVRDICEWGKNNVGIVWVEHTSLANALRKHGAFPVYTGGEESSALLAAERGTRTIVASIAAHGTGKNLQAFSKNLVITPPSGGDVWEQLIGRTCRPGQKEDSVSVEVYRHTPAVTGALDRAKDLAKYIQGTLGGRQKLLQATYLWD